VLQRTDVWTSNADEATAVTGLADPAESVAGVAALLGDDAVAVVRDGPRGCHVREAGHTAYLPGYPQEPVDTNGAGDCHTGVLVAERARGADWVTAARRANAAGAIKVTRRGPATAPTSAEIDAFLAVNAHR
jgi:sugar/nucleoside kinase (ribokinase family)